MFFRRFITLERLQDTSEDLDTLKGLSKNQRQALYNYLTARAYRLNKDSLRDSALWTRQDLLGVTKSNTNTIPFDRDVKPKDLKEYLPDVFKAPKIEPSPAKKDDPLP